MFLLVAVLIGVVTAPLAGGRLGRLADVPLRMPAAPVAALLMQAVIAATAGAPPALLAAAHVASYVVAAAFVVTNLDRVGIVLLGAGGALNATAIVANGGVMPASAAAVARAGLAHEADVFHNSAVLDAPRLGVLGDVFALPAGWPLANVFSIGDVVLFAAGVVLVHELAAAPWSLRLRRSRAACAPYARRHARCPRHPLGATRRGAAQRRTRGARGAAEA